MDSVQQVDNREVAGSLSLDNRPKGFDLAIVGWVLILVGLLTILENLLGARPQDIGMGKAFAIFFSCLAPIILAHEGIHTLVLRYFGCKVKIGFKWTKLGPAFFSQPKESLPRYKFQMVLASPQVLTIIAAILLTQFISPVIRHILIIIILCNLGGGFLDFYVIRWLSKFPKTYMVQDTEKGGIVYKC